MVELPTIIILAHAIATYLMLGIIWLVQIVNYPLFSSMDEVSFRRYHSGHVKRITLVVAVPMLGEMLTFLLMFFIPSQKIPMMFMWVGFTLLAIIWLMTVLFLIPQHDKLIKGFNASAHEMLVRANWVRTLLWSFRGVLVTAMLVVILLGA